MRVADRMLRAGSAISLDCCQRPSCHEVTASVTTKVMLARPHIKKRWFMVVPCGQGAKTEDGKGE